jgi:hypothetical protein
VIFTFGPYTVRAVTERDRAYLEHLIATDEYHRDCMTPDFFLSLQPGEEAWALEEGERIVFYFKTAAAVRVAIQFTDAGDLRAKRKNGLALIEGLAWFAAMLTHNRFREVFFDTEGPELHDFAKRHLGFAETPGLLSLKLGTNPTKEIQPESMGSVPTNGLGR